MFMSALSKAKERIARMDFRFIEETDPIKQTLACARSKSAVLAAKR
jgi:hypothetical protein